MNEEIIVIEEQDLPATFNLKMTPGVDWRSPEFEHNNPDGSPMDLTGATITPAIRTRPVKDAPEAIALVDIQVVPVEANSFYLEVLKEANSGISANRIFYSIVVEDSLGAEWPFWSGTIEIERTA